MKTLKIFLAAAIMMMATSIAALAQNNKDDEPPSDPIVGSWKYSATTLHPESAENVKKQLNSPEKLEKRMG